MSNDLFHAFKALNPRTARELPTFSGEIGEWPIFESEFYSSTHEFHVSDRENLRRLIKSLQGKAKKVVEPLLTSPSKKLISKFQTKYSRANCVSFYRKCDAPNFSWRKERHVFKTLNIIFSHSIVNFKTYFVGQSIPIQITLFWSKVPALNCFQLSALTA